MKAYGKVLAEPNEIFKGEGFVLMPNAHGRRKRVAMYDGLPIEVSQREHQRKTEESFEPEPVEYGARHCGDCEREFLALHSDQRYCQQACYRRRTNRRKRQKREVRLAAQAAA